MLPPPSSINYMPVTGPDHVHESRSRSPVFSWEIAVRSACTEVDETEGITGHLSFANLSAITSKLPL